MPVAVATADVQTPGVRAGSLSFVDGLRALAAFAVVALHGFLFSGHVGQPQRDLPLVKDLALDGNYAVAVFITLSGFVLMVPVSRSSQCRLRGGSWRYLQRRAKRILPPYFATLVLVLLLIAALPALHEQQATPWDDQIPVTTGGVVTHALLVHNVTRVWSVQIDGPMWSIATEWQIYLLMPLVLLPLWRRVGPAQTVVLSIAAGLIVHHLLPAVDSAHYWFVGVFALGMLAAHLYVRGPRLPWLPAAGKVLCVGTVLAYVAQRDRIAANTPVSEIVVGAVSGLLLVALGEEARSQSPGLLLRVLQSRRLVSIGLFSYSIYLVHAPLLAVGGMALLHTSIGTAGRAVLMLTVVAPLSVAAAYPFHRLVERRFMTTHQEQSSLVGSSAP